MERGVKTAKVKVAAKRPVARKALESEGEVRELERRLAEALKQRAEALEQRAATSEILRVISASPTDVQPVLDAVAERAALLCKAPFARVLLVYGDRLRVAAEHSIDGTVQARTTGVPLSRTSISGRAILDHAIVHHADVLPLLDTEFPDARENARRIKFRAVLAVPLMHEGGALGAIFLWRREPGLFAPDHVALVQTFAQQAAIAIDNVRLFNATKEALEQQTAISEILRVISNSPGDVKPMLNAVAERALKLCDAAQSGIFLIEGNMLRFAARFGSMSTPMENEYFLLTRSLVVGRAAIDRETIHHPDIVPLLDTEYPDAREPQQKFGFRALLAVPLMHEDRAIGAIALWRTEVRAFTESQIALVKTFADQAAIAIENVRLFTELEMRTTQLTQSVGELKALGEVGQAVSSTLDLETVLGTIVSRATQLTGMDGGSIYEYDEAREEFYLHTTDGLPDELVEALRAAPIRKGEGALGQMAVTGELVQIRDIADEGSYQSRVREILLRSG